MNPIEQIEAFLTSRGAKPPPENSERSVTNAPRQLDDPQLVEAERIAKELVKLRDAGAIKDADDPADARFYARLIHTFEAEFIGKRESQKSENSS